MNLRANIVVGSMLVLSAGAATMTSASTKKSYFCNSKTTGNLFQLTPDFGEITKFDRRGHVLRHLDGLRTEIDFFETFPATTLIRFLNEDDLAVATIATSGSSILLKDFIYDTDKQMKCVRR